jgi:hypothetical protein
MKFFIISFFTPILLFINFDLSAQDTLYIKDGQKLGIRIVEQTKKSLRYQIPERLDNTNFEIKIKDLDSLRYRKGPIEYFGNQNPRNHMPKGVFAAAALYVTEEIGIAYGSANYFILPQVDVYLLAGSEFSGADHILGGGAKYHINRTNSRNPFTPYIGFAGGISSAYNVFYSFPVGVSYLSSFGLNMYFGANHMIWQKSNFTATFIELGLGWRFKN